MKSHTVRECEFSQACQTLKVHNYAHCDSLLLTDSPLSIGVMEEEKVKKKKKRANTKAISTTWQLAVGYKISSK